MKWTEIEYKCSCMSAAASIHVVPRDQAEDIREFMTRVQAALGADHRRRSPFCAATTVEYAKIPVDGDLIGGAPGGTA